MRAWATSRRELLGGAAAAAAGLAGCGGQDPARRPLALADDLAVLEAMARVEALQALVYEALPGVDGLPERARELADALAGDEREHRQAVEGLLADRGRRPPPPPALDRAALLARRPDGLMERVLRLEGAAARCYLGQLPRLRDPDVVSALVGVHSAEWRHVAAWTEALGRSPVLAEAAVAPRELTHAARAVREWTR